MYSVYVLEDVSVNNYKRLDCDGVDFTTIFSVADISDIANRKDSVTKHVTFKGSKTNNEAFGSAFNLNKSTDFTLANKLFFNYNALRPVDCLIYDDNILVLRGSLRLTDMPVVKGNVSYETIVTGAFIDFKTALSEKLLSDIDFTDLTHEYKVDTVQNSWDTSVQVYNGTGFTTQPYQKGSGYVYPWIDYGYNCNASGFNSTNHLNEKNLRPAVYVREYFDRIISGVSGYTYEIKNTPGEVTANISWLQYLSLNVIVVDNRNDTFDWFEVGDTITATGAGANDGTYTIIEKAIGSSTQYFFSVAETVTTASGATSTIIGSVSPVVHRFNSLIVPDCQEKATMKVFGSYWEYTGDSSRSYDETGDNPNRDNGSCWVSDSSSLPGIIVDEFIIPLHIATLHGSGLPNFLAYEGGTYNGLSNAVMRFTRDIPKATFNVSFQMSINNIYGIPTTWYVQLIARPWIDPADTDNYNPAGTAGTFDALGNVLNEYINGVTLFTVAPNTTSTFNVDFSIAERSYSQNTQLFLRVIVPGEASSSNNGGQSWPGTHYYLTVNNPSLTVPKDANTVMEVDYNLGVSGDPSFDVRKPEIPQGVKQMDFLKSVIALFNFYVYTEKERPKHLIFQTYDEYYANATLMNMQSTALNWTKKIDFSDFRFKTNVAIPKNYLFTYKDDSDFLNNDYKLQFNEAYGTKRFTDAYGVTENKKVELIFSPTPLVKASDSSKVFPMIVKNGAERATKQPTKSNIRILFYNGLKQSGEEWYLVKENTNTGGAPADTIVLTRSDKKYPQASHYYIGSDSSNLTPTHNLLFDTPKKVWFQFDSDYQTATPVYDDYYIGQTTDLTNADVVFIECDAHLTPVDIGNLNLKIPVFVDMGGFGHAYFKVLKVEYTNSDTTSKVLLQKIAV